MTPWTLLVAASAERSLDRLQEGVAAAIVEFLLGPLVDDPTVVGKPLQRDLAGRWSARRGSYRVVYEIDLDRREIRVLHIAHRSDVYRQR